MKIKLYITLLAIAATALLAIGCDENSDRTDTATNENVNEAVKSTDNKIDEVGNAFETTKADYIAKAEKLVSDYDGKIGNLKDKVNALPEITKKPLEEPLKAITAARTDVGEKYSELIDAGKDTYSDKKDQFEESFDELKSGYEKLLDKF